MPKANTKATAKYQAKVGLVAKTYKLKADIADAFKAACELSGESQAAALMRFMVEYAEKNGSGSTAQINKPLDGQLQISETTKCARCGTIYGDGYDENEFFRCAECDFGNYKPTDEDEDTAAANDDDLILEKWTAQLKKQAKKRDCHACINTVMAKANHTFL